MIADYHIHTPYCGHARGNIIQYIESAVEQGIDEIGFSDHLGRYYLTQTQRHRFWDWGMNDRDIPRYFTEISELKEIYEDKINIRIGLEVDYIEGAEDLLMPLLDICPLDFIIGSIHCIPRFGWKHISNYSDLSPLPIYKEYFRAVRLALESKLFQSIAHTDFIWRYIAWPKDASEEIFGEIDNTVKCALEYGGRIEVNANGFVWSRSHETPGKDPFEFLLETIKNYGVQVTIGSDAHEPSMVGKHFSEIIDLLHSKGINSISCFSNGAPLVKQLG